MRGQFDGLDEDQRVALRARAAEHDILQASFTREGTFVYSPALTWMNLRYELRVPDEVGDAEAEAQALEHAAQWLERRGIPATHLRVDLLDMAAMWD